MNSKRIVFVGTVKMSMTALTTLIDMSEVEVVGVMTKKESRFNSDHMDLAPIAEKNEIRWKYVDDINSPDEKNWIEERRPALIFVAGWSQLLDKDTFSLAPMGAIGFHPALLPLNRGRHPLIWAIILGLPKTGSTFFVMDEQPDHGKILSQREVSIDPRETAFSLYRKIQNAMAQQIPRFLPQFLSGIIHPYSTPDQTGNIWRKRSSDDGLIDFRMSTLNIDRLVRALTKPYPGSEIVVLERCYVVWRAEPSTDSWPSNLEPGKVLATDSITGIVTVKTGDGAIKLVEHQFPELPSVGSYL